MFLAITVITFFLRCESTGSWVMANPVAITVTLISSPIESSRTRPRLKTPVLPIRARTSSMIWRSSSALMARPSSPLQVMFTMAFWAEARSRLLSSGDFRAASTALMARFSPWARPIPIMATPLLAITRLTSAKSALMKPLLVMISAILFTAVQSTSSALWKAEKISRSE